MQLSEFAIDEVFWCTGREWRCTDIGTRVIVAIRIDRVEVDGNTPELRRTLSRAEAETEGWFNGPPYAVSEIVFDENDIESCSRGPDADEARHTTDGISPELMAGLRKEAGQNARIFQAIGEFLFNFSQLEFSIRARLAAAMNLTDEQFDAITGPYDFAILCTVTKTILSKKFPDGKTEIDKVFNQCRKLNEDRVRIAHGLWTRGANGLMSRHVSRQNLEYKYHYEDPRQLPVLAERARRLMERVLFVPNQLNQSNEAVLGEQQSTRQGR